MIDYVPNIPAKEEKTVSGARFFGENAHPWREKGNSKAPEEREEAPYGIKGLCCLENLGFPLKKEWQRSFKVGFRSREDFSA